MIERFLAEQLPDGEGGDDRGENERAEGFHGQRLQDDLGHEERAADGRIVGGGDASRGAAGDEQAELQGGCLAPASDA